MAKNDSNKGKEKDEAPKVSKGATLIARISLKGDFELGDGLGARAVEVSPGDEFKTADADLAQKLVDRGYAKLKGAKDDGVERPAIGDGA